MRCGYTQRAGGWPNVHKGGFMERSTRNLLRRWMALDQHLYRGGLLVSEFAEIWMVDRMTVRRDLKAFNRLGYPAELVVRKSGAVYLWRYPPGRRPMFTASLRPAEGDRQGMGLEQSTRISPEPTAESDGR